VVIKVYRDRLKIMVEILEKLLEKSENIPSRIAGAVNLSHNNLMKKVNDMEKAELLEKIPRDKKDHWNTTFKLKIMPKGVEIVESYKKMNELTRILFQ
jgi:predicted transcriptional regulator